MQNEDLSYTKRNQCHLRQASAVAIVEQETPPGTEGVLTEVALGTPGRFPAFDNLVTLTVRAADGDERHGPFLPMRSYEEKAQCDIHLSPSPLLKHYPLPAHVTGLCTPPPKQQRRRINPCSTGVYAMPAEVGMLLCHTRTWGGYAKYAMVCSLKRAARDQ